MVSRPVNVGRLALRQFGLRPCTPQGVMTLLGAHRPAGARRSSAVVVGVSNHVGRPLALELLIAGCTTTVAATSSRATSKRACARPTSSSSRSAARPGQGRMDQAGRGGDRRRHQPAGRRPAGRRRRFAAAAERASWITPVPGGVGPMTVATLMREHAGSRRSRGPSQRSAASLKVCSRQDSPASTQASAAAGRV